MKVLPVCGLYKTKTNCLRQSKFLTMYEWVVLLLLQLLQDIGSCGHNCLLLSKLNAYFFFCFFFNWGSKAQNHLLVYYQNKNEPHVRFGQNKVAQHVWVTRRVSPQAPPHYPMPQEHRRKRRKDGTERRLQPQWKSYDWWDTTMITDNGWQRRLYGKLQTPLHWQRHTLISAAIPLEK